MTVRKQLSDTVAIPVGERVVIALGKKKRLTQCGRPLLCIGFIECGQLSGLAFHLQ